MSERDHAKVAIEVRCMIAEEKYEYRNKENDKCDMQAVMKRVKPEPTLTVQDARQAVGVLFQASEDNFATIPLPQATLPQQPRQNNQQAKPKRLDGSRK